MNWIEKAKEVFRVQKPEHFTNYLHCKECAEHDETLLKNDCDSISLEELGSPGWDPICFSHAKGKVYYTPAFVRLTLESMDTEPYMDQFLFHLEGDGKNNDYFMACSKAQRQFIAQFLEYLIDEYSDVIDECMLANNIVRTHEVWSSTES